MTSFVVTADNLRGYARGDVVDGDDFDNPAALLASGHLAIQATQATPEADEEADEQ